MADEDRNFWSGTNPSTGAAALFAVLFGAGAIAHTYQMTRYRAWYFTPFVIGAIMMTIGYISRIISIRSPTVLGTYIMQSLFLILPPSLYAATIYMIYGRLVLFVDAAHLSLIRPTRVTKIFVTGDVIGFLIQGGGGGMLASEGNETLGRNILLVGLFFQLAFFGFFIVVSGVFNYRVNKEGLGMQTAGGKYRWRTMMKVLYAASVLIIVRCIFRVIEFSGGENGRLRTEEVWMYVFDAVPMLVVQCVFHFVHGGMVLPKDVKKGKRAVEEEEGMVNMNLRSMQGR